jgi:serine/threonine protein kinase
MIPSTIHRASENGRPQGPLPGQRAMEIMADVCAALDFSHRHGIVYRDVKPANVMITRNGAVKVMDSGIATDQLNIKDDVVIGTAQYLSPEQARGEGVDARSDVYAAGCVLYELLTGEPRSPVTPRSRWPTSTSVWTRHRRPCAMATLVGQMDAVVLKAMAKGAADRYQSAAEMRMALVSVLSGNRP